jgi:PAS domain S-box-containing protein
MTADGRRGRASGDRLANRPEFFERLVQSTTDAVVSFDRDGEIVFANDASVNLLGYDPGDLHGRPVVDLVPERLRGWFEGALDSETDTGRRFAGWDGAEFLVRTADGTERPVSITIAEHVHGGRPVLSAIVRDISDRVERREALERRLAAATDGDAGTAAAAVAADGDGAVTTDGDGAVVTDADRRPATDPDRVSLADIAAEAWEAATPADATLRVDGIATVEVPTDQLRGFLADCFRAVDDGADTVNLGPLGPDGETTGFYLAADGLTVPAADDGAPTPIEAVRRATPDDWDVAVDRSAGDSRLVVDLA